MKVLILSNSDNIHARRVAEDVLKSGANPVILNMDQIAEKQTKIGIGYDGLFLNDVLFPQSEVTGIFVHHPRVGVEANMVFDDTDRNLAFASWKNALDLFEDAYPECVWINRFSVCRNGASVLRQLNIAKNKGLLVPDFCFTNDLEILLRFSKKYKKVLLKTGNLAIYLPGQRILAQLIDPKTLKPEDILYAPCLFENYIEKLFEVRVHVIGEHVYSCKIESQVNSKTQVDWRNYNVAETPHSVFELDSETAGKCVSITKELGLKVGIIDLIYTPDGEIIFLECNAQGHWIWIEELTGLPITKAIASLLVDSN